MNDNWYQNVVVYSLDVETFYDANGDGIGDFAGLTAKLDYLQNLGVNCLWLLPFFASPNRDNGYDVEDYFSIDPMLGDMADFENFMAEAQKRNLKIIADLVINHTSDQHPWFREARKGPQSPYYDYYIWSKKRPSDIRDENMFPGEEDTTFSYDAVADAYYLHRFYKEQPDLNIANPEVRKEIRKIMHFWLKKGIAGFRVDAAHILTQLDQEFDEKEVRHSFEILDDLRRWAEEINPDAVLIAEANASPEELKFYFGTGDLPNRMHGIFNFVANQYLFLAMAREKSLAFRQGCEALPMPPPGCRYLNFIRHHDELTLDQLSPEELGQVMQAFAPEKNMQIYGRGIRRRLPPMFNNNRQRIELIYSLMFSMPGIPLIRYGDEIGMGDDLNLPGRDSVRTVMQWSAERSAGFSRLPACDLQRPVIEQGEYHYEKVNVAAQLQQKNSLFHWFKKLVALRLAHPEIQLSRFHWFDTSHNAIAAIRYASAEHDLLLCHNLGQAEAAFDLPENLAPENLTLLFGEGERRQQIFSLKPYGYAWLEIRNQAGTNF